MKANHNLKISALGLSLFISSVFSFSLIIYEQALIKQTVIGMLYASCLIPLTYTYLNKMTRESLSRLLTTSILSWLVLNVLLLLTYFSFWPLFKYIHTHFGVNAFSWDGHLIRLIYATPSYLFSAILISHLFDRQFGKINISRQLGSNWQALILILCLTLALIFYRLVVGAIMTGVLYLLS